ncbi:unnamed protein product [Brugia pahangi]|uniref:RNase H domain-containing protein n=1 Tax=Brugia pahangi TaxID=6280 RepID=A0A0N4TN79_BRUPA|nr:unnamed protein product [Brugia pahangi]
MGVNEIPKLATDISQRRQLHIFTDASSVISNERNNERGRVLLFAKSRLAPIKGMNIPRLELLAMLTGCAVVEFKVRITLDTKSIEVAIYNFHYDTSHVIMTRLILQSRDSSRKIQTI